MKQEKKERRAITKGDIFLLAGLLLFALLFWLAVRAFTPAGTQVEISVDGKTEMLLPLDRDTDQLIKTEAGTNLVRIRDGKVTCEEADCPDKLCVKHSAISNLGETIICLPHKVVLEIREGGAT